MESPPISKLRFLDSANSVIAVPLEWTTARIEILLPQEDWRKVTLTLQSRLIPIQLTQRADRVVMYAEWPQSNPGHYQLQLKWPDGHEQLVVKILPKKISDSSLAQLFSDLELALPSAAAISLQQLGAFSGITILPPSESTMAQEVVRLQRAIEGTTTRAGLAAVLDDIAKRPHQILKVYEPWVKANQARRPHPARITQAITCAYNIDADKRPNTVLDTRVEHTFDVYENRLVRTFLHQVEQRLAIVKRAVGVARSVEQLQECLQKLQNKLQQAKRRATFLRSVSLLNELPTSATMVLLNRPAYRSAFQGFQEFRKSYSVRINEPRLDAPLENLPALYQLWGTMAVIQVVLECAVEVGYHVKKQSLVSRDSSGLFYQLLPNGEPVLVFFHKESGTTVRLIPERAYRKSGLLQSISFQQRPDIALEIESPNGETRILLFDPKYKLKSEEFAMVSEDDDEGQPMGTPKKVDIDKMHAYRDAIRSSDLRRAVTYAAILYPGAEVRYADDIEALRAYPGDLGALTQRVKQVVMRELQEHMT